MKILWMSQSDGSMINWLYDQYTTISSEPYLDQFI